MKITRFENLSHWQEPKKSRKIVMEITRKSQIKKVFQIRQKDK